MADLSEDMSDLAHHFLNEAASIQKGGSVAVDDLAVLPVLDAWASSLQWARTTDLSDREIEGIAQAANEAAEAHGLYKHSHGQNKGNALASVQAHLDVFPAIWDERVKAGQPASDFTDNRRRIERAQKESAELMSVMVYVTERTAELDRAIAGVKEAEQNAVAAVALAKKAATETSTSALEASFETTAKNNNTIAWWFRVATIVALIAVVALGAFFAIDHAAAEGESVDWYGIVYRVAVLSGLGAIAAYLGRQAGNYSRLATWAHGIRIQLKAFLGFVNEIEDEDAKQTMYALFGKRVLESPPDGKHSADDSPTNLIQPIFEQAAKLRPPTT